MSVLVVMFVNSSILRHFLGVFLHVVSGRIGHHARSRDLVPDVVGEGYGIAANFPGTSVVADQQKFFAAVFGLLQASGDGASRRLVSVIVLRQRPSGYRAHEN